VLNQTCELLQKVAMMSGVASSEEYQHFDFIRQNRQDPIGYYQLGNRFFQMQQPLLARPFLAHAKKLLGDTKNELSQAVDVDFAQVEMDLGHYEEAITAFHELNESYGGLPIWLIMEMAESYALLRQIDEAEAVYQIAAPEAAAQFPGMEQVREEVGDMLARVRDFDEQEEMSLREWHYVQTRGMLMETNPDENVPGERFVFFQPSEEDVAYIVGMTAALLDAKGYAPNRLLWLGDASEPLALLFAQWWEIEPENIRPYRSGDNNDSEDEVSLLVMAHSYLIPDESTYLELLPAKSGLILFALDLRWTERQPVTPDIAGFMSQACNLPWETRIQLNEDQQSVTQIEESRDPQTIAEDIAKQFPSEEECDEYAQETLEVYEPCTDLILDHRDGTLNRRPLVTHSPVTSPRFGFSQ
jgi:tetratricopeptide (TPR) repeat protein